MYVALRPRSRLNIVPDWLRWGYMVDVAGRLRMTTPGRVQIYAGQLAELGGLTFIEFPLASNAASPAQPDPLGLWDARPVGQTIPALPGR